MMVYIVTLKILESYHLQFQSHSRKGESIYSQQCIPLARELFGYHLNKNHLDKTNNIFKELSNKHAEEIGVDNSDYFESHF